MTERRTKKSIWPGRFRIIGALVLATAFFLPLSSCSNSIAGNQEGGQAVSADAEVEATAEGQRSYRYPFKMLATDDLESLLIIFAFFWPTFALAYRRSKRHETSVKFVILEFLLCFFTMWVVWSVSLFERLEIGGYLAFAGVMLCLAAASTFLFQEFRQWRFDRQHLTR